MLKTLNRRGLLITIEGGEGAGKTTLINALERALQAQSMISLKTREPGGCGLGERIRTLLLEKDRFEVGERAELLLFLASRAQHVLECIEPALANGKVVLCDRFSDSTLAYQGVARGLGIESLRRLCDFAAAGLWPDLTFYLDIDPQIGLERISADENRVGMIDRMEAQALDFHQSVRQGFLTLAASEPERICIIDARLPAEGVFEKAWSYLQMRLEPLRETSI